ncbi:MAG: PEP-CTERM sorting domain-containing protein [Verrucomicrobiota bacterium JB023]|nr:PEP-CTERM sorting domain-containing protein [Verrucomicrobiota bacterium JB023]
MKKSVTYISLASLMSVGALHGASFAVNIDVPDTRGDGDAGVPTINDFISQNPASGLTVSSVFFNSTGTGNASNFGNNFSGGVLLDGFTVTTSEDDLDGGNGTNSGFNAGDASHNDLNPITEGYAFNAQNTVVTIDGLLANSSLGDTIILSMWGIGDNLGQDATFVVTYGGNISLESVTNTQSTLYNGAGESRDSAVGSVPFVNFTFAADGLTDQISFAIDPNSGSGTTINAFSLAVLPVPEPSSALLLGLGTLGLLRRKRA